MVFGYDMDYLKAYQDPDLFNNDTLYASSGLTYRHLFYPEKIYFHPIYCKHQIQRIGEIYSRSLLYAFIYVIAIFVGKHWMKNRPAFDLRNELVAWNITLAAFSTLGTFYFLGCLEAFESFFIKNLHIFPITLVIFE
jgi:hypothetical protein